MWAREIGRASSMLADAGVPSPDVDARLLAEHVRHPVEPARQIDDAERAAYGKLVALRAQRVPLQHIVGTMYFRYLELEARPGVFIVRPETEMVAQAALDELAKMRAEAGGLASHSGRPVVVDLCTGSGAIAISIATEADADVSAVEISPEAYESAQRNNAAYGGKVRLVHGDALTALDELAGKVDMVVTNPPYVRGDHELNPEVRHDPELALFGGGVDGLELPVRLIRRAHELLRPGGILIMEHGDDQALALRDAADDAGFRARTGQDLTGRDRWLRARKTGPAKGEQ
ncbi:peptide chain release factor N(5)-glutamine methyltransferase [Trueperella bialowiezensis]|uniref:peptide chain release factor N(5)-glutamine methyltransferase n=1 Tax=Trueperella bialowiezensis TaxID=312285 RepID=A0A448PFP7_9ACTO|nr:peptide chain release factor N(5)-glutamine methyltransferase [Trueperella bialowiezensis]VEI13757.1 Release factor glutamine methyltransferase [Trueperella bialowiezensis]